MSQEVPGGGAADGPANEPPRALPNLRMPTLGGVQFWTDHEWRRGWRIQHNAVTGHYRLLDPSNVRFAWGNLAACEQELESRQPGKSIAAKTIVMLLHGLGRSSASMQGLGKTLERETDCQVVYFEYASTRNSIAKHAEALRKVIAGFPPDTDICFACHSMGNIVVRHAIADWQTAKDAATLARIKSMVMLGPPNQGAAIAKQLSKTGVFGAVTGEGGMELGANWDKLQERLATPHCPFGIIAGRLPTYLSNPLVGAEGDFVVGVEEARLDGAADFLEVARMHSFLMDDPEVQKAAIRFMATHKFSDASAKQP
ncbi:MAG: alpha/beta hydrolase [Aureliella sp.]